MLAADDTLSLDMRLAPAVDTRQRNFWIALLVALAVHAALLVEISRSGSEHELRRLGSQNGADNAIAVELVTAADLKSLSSVATPPEGGAPAFKPPVQPQEVQPQEVQPKEAQQQEAQPQETPPPPQPETPPAQEPKAAEPPAPEPKTVETKTAEPAVKAEAKPQPAAEPTPTVPDFETLAPEFAEPAPNAAKETPPETKKAEPVEKQAQPEAAQKQVKSETAEKQAKPQPPAKKKQQQAKLDLSPPSTMPNPSNSGPGRSTAATRPAGITRSGENDRFGIAAIRALAQTFPMLNNTYGRVTVRLLLNENGDLVDVRVVQSSGKPQLDQSVVFSTRQASFPLPPRGSTEIDRTFIVTYVYR